LGSKEKRDLLILRGEVAVAFLLGQVQVPERDASEQYRDAEESLHGRVPGGKSDGTRILREVVEPEWLRVGDEDAENAASMRRIADRRLRALVDSERHEALEAGARWVDHAEGCITCLCQLRRGFHQSRQQCVEGELGGQRNSGLDQRPQA